MATVENITNRLLQVLSPTEQSCAIALTGEWGIGKTHFWKEFYKNHHKQFGSQKYAYVSLFGLETLEALKYEIAIKTHSSIQKDDKLSKVKNSFTNILSSIEFPKLEGNGLTLSIGKELISNVISSSIQDTIICIDDLERKSEKLDIKDIMGLISQLKSENNCKIIVILHEEKVEDIYKEYKEKVFDNVFYLTENLSIIDKIINDNDMFFVYKDFYEKLDEKNLRFYLKVKRDYDDIITEIEDLSASSKEYILRGLFVARRAFDGNKKIPYKNEQGDEENIIFNKEYLLENDFCFLSDRDLSKHYKKIDILNNFFNGFYSFYNDNIWIGVILEYISNYNLDKSSINDLINKSKISEDEIQRKMEKDDILAEYHSLALKENFIKRFYDIVTKSIDQEHFNNLNFYYHIIKYDSTLADLFKKSVENYILEQINKNKGHIFISDFYPFSRSDDDVFYHFINQSIRSYKPNINNVSIEDFWDIINEIINGATPKDWQREILERLDKESLKIMIWDKVSDARFERKIFIKSIVSFQFLSDSKRDEIRTWIIELLQEKIQENPENKVPIEMWLRDTNDLTEFK